MPTHRPPATDLTPLLRLPRQELLEALGSHFPLSHRPPDAGATFPRGGRAAALERLSRIDPVAYARSRNHVSGDATGLSPWIRHGVLSLAEVRDRCLSLVENPAAAGKLVSELAWRDYWRRVQESLGERILRSIEAPCTAPSRQPLTAVPEEVRAGSTGLSCIDAFVRSLVATGHLHNHERLWLASWLVHHRGIDWRAGADWFLEHLLDGDPASNHLSWQWVAGTFAAKPYLARRETIESCTDGMHCTGCPRSSDCPFDSATAPAGVTERAAVRIAPGTPWRPSDAPAAGHPLVWLTLDSAAAESPAARRHPGAPRLFVIDRSWAEEERVSLARLAFLIECLAEVPSVTVEAGDPIEACLRVAAERGCDGVAVAESPCPRIRHAASGIAARLPVSWLPWPRFVDGTAIRDLGRFSRYWNAVRESALRPTPEGP